MDDLKVPVQIEGEATVRVATNLKATEEEAAKHMAELVATMQLLSVNTHQLEHNVKKFQEIADRFDLSLDRTREIFRSLKVERMEGDSGIGPMEIRY